MRKADIVIIDGQPYVETEDHRYGLGLQMPPSRTLQAPTLASRVPLLTLEEVRQVVDSEDFYFGQTLFDTSWITNQNGYGSCASYAGASALAKARVLMGQPRVDLSGDYLYSLVNGGRDSGSMLDENMQKILSSGVASAGTVPLGGIYRHKYDRSVADAEAQRYRGHELYAVPDEQSMATALAMRIPVVIAIHVTRRWRDFDSDDVLADARGVGNHSEHCDDIKYDRKRGKLLYRKATSHGKSYSDDGYCWTHWDGHYSQTSRNHMFYAVPSAIADPYGENAPLPNGDDAGPEPVPPVDAPEIVMHSSNGCGWCTKWEREEQPKAVAAGWRVTKETAGGPVPRFTVRKSGRTAERTGFTPFTTLASLV